jgi:glycosyltransferase involved in cell wall biosynthesis
VGTAVGGLPEVVIQGDTGALRPVGDIAGMADAAVDILGDHARWSRMSAAAAADARRRFALDDIVAQYEALYERALAEPRSVPSVPSLATT